MKVRVSYARNFHNYANRLPTGNLQSMKGVANKLASQSGILIREYFLDNTLIIIHLRLLNYFEHNVMYDTGCPEN